MDDQNSPILKTLVINDIVDSTQLFRELGDLLANQLMARHDRLARDLLVQHQGTEIDKTDGFLILFDQPSLAIGYALAYHDLLRCLGEEHGVKLTARAGIHVGDVYLRENTPEDVHRGAKPLEVEGIAKAITARLAEVALGKQTLLSGTAFNLGRHAKLDLRQMSSGAALRWLAHGPYSFKGLDAPMEVFEVGLNGFAPLTAPANSEKAKRLVTAADAVTLGWRPAPGLAIPYRTEWTVESKIGEGGFGEVWAATCDSSSAQRIFKFCYDANNLRALQREVTFVRFLKVALGQRDDIATILDWNLDKAPFFIELVYFEGGNLAEWSERQGGLVSIPVETRIELIAQVADALAAAHSVGILHQDVKPGNVLMTADDDGCPRAVLSDFGIGQVIDRELLVDQGITVLGVTDLQINSTAGTQLYVAPERLEGKVATVQADIYALGVMLYQVLIGDFSHALASGWEHEIDDELLREDIAAFSDGSPERRVRSVEEVATRLRGLEARRAERLAQRQAKRDAEAARRQQEKSQRRRRMFGVAMAALAVFSAAMAYQVQRANREAQRASQETTISRQVSDFMIRLFETNDPNASNGQTVTAKELLDQGSRRIAELDEEPEIQTRLMMSMGRAYRSLGLFPEAGDLLGTVIDKRSAHYGDHSLEVAEALCELGDVLYQANEYLSAEQAQAKCVNIRRDHLTSVHPDTLRAVELLGAITMQLNRYDASEALLREVLAAHQAGHLNDDRVVSDALTDLAFVLFYQGDHDGASPLFERAIAVRRAVFGEDHTEYAVALNNYGYFLTKIGRYKAAEPVYREALAILRKRYANHPSLAYSLTGMARLLNSMERYTEAADLGGEALSILRRHSLDDTWRGAIVLSLIGVARQGQGRLDEAEEALLESVSGVIHPGSVDDDAIPVSVQKVLLERVITFYDQQGDKQAALPFTGLRAALE